MERGRDTRRASAGLGGTRGNRDRSVWSRHAGWPSGRCRFRGHNRRLSRGRGALAANRRRSSARRPHCFTRPPVASWRMLAQPAAAPDRHCRGRHRLTVFVLTVLGRSRIDGGRPIKRPRLKCSAERSHTPCGTRVGRHLHPNNRFASSTPPLPNSLGESHQGS